jgi:tetratricopeptide (TPR) repeat protein
LLKILLFSLLTFNLFALELSITGAKENFSPYSTLHLEENTPFLCQETKDDFEIVTKIVCAFTKKPPRKMRLIQNSFFKVENVLKKKTFFLIITPYYKIKLYPMIFDMTKNKAMYQVDVSLAKHWMIVGYKTKLPFIKKEPIVDSSINFPFELETDNLPFVGSLDIKGDPVHIKRVGDVTDYLKIKKLYEDKKYERCLELIEEVMEGYPNSLFNAELIFYKIRVYSKVNDHDNVIKMSKMYLKEYSSDENVPEVLSLLAYSYHKVGMSTDADYFFDRLFSEHENSEYSKLGFIYLGEMLESSGASSKAISYYKRALNETTRVETAAMAAYSLAKYYIMTGNMKEGSKYIMKIVDAKPAFFIDDLVTSMNLMYKLGDNEEYVTASAIAKSITDATDKRHDEHENLMKEKAMWLTHTEDKNKALEALNEYIAQYKYGTYEEMIEVAKDELFFDTSDGNFTVKLTEYNSLIEEYKNDTIGYRAIYEKSKLLLENRKFSEVLDFEETILSLDEDMYVDTDVIIKDAAVGVMKIALGEKKCQEVLDISHDYNVTLSNDWDNGIYECAMIGSNFTLSKEIAKRNLSSKNIELRKKWLYRYIKVDFETGNYSDIIEPAKELIILIEDEKELFYKDVYRMLFDSYQRLEEKEKLLDVMMRIQEIFGSDYRDIERYVEIMSIGNKKKDNVIVIKYAEEVMKIQNTSSSYAQSPFVEFTLYQTYLDLKDLEKSLNVIKSLDTVELNNRDRARQKYLLGTVYSKLWREADAAKAYDGAIEADPDSAWAKLAMSAKNI